MWGFICKYDIFEFWAETECKDVTPAISIIHFPIKFSDIPTFLLFTDIDGTKLWVSKRTQVDWNVEKLRLHGACLQISGSSNVFIYLCIFYPYFLKYKSWCLCEHFQLCHNSFTDFEALRIYFMQHNIRSWKGKTATALWLKSQRRLRSLLGVTTLRVKYSVIWPWGSLSTFSRHSTTVYH